MKRLGLLLALVLPALALASWTLFPQADPRLAAPLFHFYIVTFTTFAAAVVSLFVTISVGETALPRHLLLAVAFAWMAGVFFIHGLTTTGALITQFHPGIVWSSWLTLFGGGAIFLAGALAPNQPSPRFLRAVLITISGLYLAFVAAVLLLPGLLSQLLALRVSPALGDLVFGLTLVVWAAAAWRHFRHYRHSRNLVDGLMAFEAAWYAVATVSMFRFSLWQASWWLYHVLLLVGFLVAVYTLWRAYEQIRAFRLVRYYAATSLIVTAALALLAAQVYTNVVFQNLRAQLERDTAALSQLAAAALGRELAQVDSPETLRQLGPAGRLAEPMSNVLSSLPVFSSLTLYDATGAPLHTTVAGAEASPADDVELFAAAAHGALALELIEPGEDGPGYGPSADAHLLEAYVPVWPDGDPQAPAGPVGVLVTYRAAPELTRALVVSRGAGLALAALSLGALFLALLVLVRRADQLITQRTRELESAYAHLRQAEGMRDDLTRMIVHDLRSPLTAIAANLELIGKTLNNPAYPDAPPRFLASARGAGQRMMGMIDDLLNVSKFEAGELRPALAPVYLPTLLREKADNFHSQAEKERKHLCVQAPADLPVVMADASLVGRVVENLLSNAFKYTDTGGKIQVEAQRGPALVLVRVCDDGQGIPPEFHQRIFEKFVQVTDQHGQPLRKGTGLGLAFCRLAVEAHGGQIRVESARGQGSTFTFSLPLNCDKELGAG